MAVLQALALACLWAVQYLSLHMARWQPVIASQLAGNALAKVAPGGGAMGSALQYRMLADAGLPRGSIVSGLTASNLLVLGIVLALPVFSLPAILRGGVQHDLLNAAVAGLAIFVVLFGLGVVLLSSDRALRWVGRLIQRVRNKLRRRSEPLHGLPERLSVSATRSSARSGRAGSARSPRRSGAGRSTSAACWPRCGRSTCSRAPGSSCSRSAPRRCWRRSR